MKIGYAAQNSTLDCSASRSFRLASFNEERLSQTIKENLDCLKRILEFNLDQKIYFFHLPSGIIPFGSHPINKVNWRGIFAQDFKEIHDFIRLKEMKICLHPDHYVVINTPSEEIFKNSLGELIYQADLINLLRADQSSKVQIHVGGAYGDKPLSRAKFIERFKRLPEEVREVLAIENDGRLFNLNDCLKISAQTGLPIVLDTLHQEINNQGESLTEALSLAFDTWENNQTPTVHYSSQQQGKMPGAHAQSLDKRLFESFIKNTMGFDFDIMLEFKDKEKSALEALPIARKYRLLLLPFFLLSFGALFTYCR
jgi:UV DNA damage endonuclease